MPGELLDIGERPRLIASFAPPGARDRFTAWAASHADAIASIPPHAYRVEYAWSGAGLQIRVRVNEDAIPPGLDGPDELGAAAGLPPRPPSAA